jgi:hypothetical protein
VRQIVAFEEHVLVQKSDKYNRLKTLPARLEASNKVDALTRDIDARFTANKLLIKQNKKAAHARRAQQAREQLSSQDESGGVTFSERPQSPPSPLAPLVLPGIDSAERRAESFLKYEIPKELRQGAAFSLWPAKAYGVSTALRVSDKLSAVAGEAGGISEATFSTRWDQEKDL